MAATVLRVGYRLDEKVRGPVAFDETVRARRGGCRCTVFTAVARVAGRSIAIDTKRDGMGDPTEGTGFLNELLVLQSSTKDRPITRLLFQFPQECVDSDVLLVLWLALLLV
jgi:hypothetical protein